MLLAKLRLLSRRADKVPSSPSSSALAFASTNTTSLKSMEISADGETTAPIGGVRSRISGGVMSRIRNLASSPISASVKAGPAMSQTAVAV